MTAKESPVELFKRSLAQTTRALAGAEEELEVAGVDLVWEEGLFRSAGTGSYPDLLRAVAIDPAMLWYLDGRDSTGTAPNENFSRELMANYFTYSAERGTHFVLFDDEETLRQKVSLAQRLGIPSAFVMYPEIADLLQAK